MGLFSKKKEVSVPKPKTYPKNRKARRRDDKWDRGADQRERIAKVEKMIDNGKKARRAAILRRAEATHERAVQRRLKAGKPVTYSRRRRNYAPAKA